MTEHMNENQKGVAMQSEEAFQKLMPISGKVDTFFGEFELDHSFPTHEAGEQPIYHLEHTNGYIRKRDHRSNKR